MDDETLYLHAVVVKKPIPLALARLRAQSFIKNKQKTFFRETEDSYRFRNIPKQSFKDFVSKKISDEITIILGHLNDKALGKTDMEAK
jgi:hypothetical protein